MERLDPGVELDEVGPALGGQTLQVDRGPPARLPAPGLGHRRHHLPLQTRPAFLEAGDGPLHLPAGASAEAGEEPPSGPGEAQAQGAAQAEDEAEEGRPGFICRSKQHFSKTGGTMHWKNNHNNYGAVSIALHWLSAIIILGLFILGLWMVELDYYDAWYKQAPAIHKSIGILLFMLIAVRLLWRLVNPRPEPIGKPLEKRLAEWMHRLLYLLLFTTMIAGYLISTAEGRGIEVFGWFTVPATFYGPEHQEDIAGEVHEILAWLLILLSVGHALAALKHHFVDRDDTLRRMLRLTHND